MLHERYTSSGDPRYCTAIFGTLEPDPVTGESPSTSPQAAIPQPWSCAATARAGYLPTPGGLLVGILPKAHFTAADDRAHPGDTLLLYTDGLTEARTGEEPHQPVRRRRPARLRRRPCRQPPRPLVIQALTGLLDRLRRRPRRRHRPARPRRAATACLIRRDPSAT